MDPTDNKNRRRRLRLADYDYSQAGVYFVTMCAQQRVCLFGDVVDGVMRTNAAGSMITGWWSELNRKFPDVETDEFVVMPNHFHGIVFLSVGADLRVGPGSKAGEGAHAGAPLPKIMQWFKTMTTNEYIRGVREQYWAPFARQMWQRNYYEHVIRNEDSLFRIRQYIADNPPKWEFDRENPLAAKPEPKDAWLR